VFALPDAADRHGQESLGDRLAHPAAAWFLAGTVCLAVGVTTIAFAAPQASS